MNDLQSKCTPYIQNIEVVYIIFGGNLWKTIVQEVICSKNLEMKNYSTKGDLLKKCRNKFLEKIHSGGN